MNADLRRIEKIKEHCISIQAFVSESPEAWSIENSMAYKAICMDLIVIGEHAGNLSEEFVSANPQIPWRRIKNFRNIVAHDYDAIENKYFVPIVETSIPELKAFCVSVLVK